MATAGLGALSFTGYASLVEPNWLDVGRHQLSLPGRASAPPLRVLHLADLHAPWRGGLDVIDEAVTLGLSLKPDLICLTGDFFTRTCDQIDEFAGILCRLSAAAPSFACLGNHDGGHWAGKPLRGGYKDTRQSRRLLEQAHVQLLDNRSSQIVLKGRPLAIVGVGDPWARDFRPGKAFAALPASASQIRIVLSHNPDTKDELQPYSWDLLLSGHTHGGQLFLPLLGAPFAPVQDKRFIAGLYDWEGRFIHITKGVGSGFKMRFNCRPEVSLLTIT